MGREVRLVVGEKEKFLDLLFYNTKAHCYVVVEVKTGDFDSANAGQLGTYVVAVNHQIKTEYDNPNDWSFSMSWFGSGRSAICLGI